MILSNFPTKTITPESIGAIPNPSGGSTGQLLYKTDSGAEWGDKPVMVVNITGAEGNYQADKTFEEIGNAYSSGTIVYATWANLIFSLLQYVPSSTVLFYATSDGIEYYITFTSKGVDVQLYSVKAKNISFTKKDIMIVAEATVRSLRFPGNCTVVYEGGRSGIYLFIPHGDATIRYE